MRCGARTTHIKPHAVSKTTEKRETSTLRLSAGKRFTNSHTWSAVLHEPSDHQGREPRKACLKNWKVCKMFAIQRKQPVFTIILCAFISAGAGPCAPVYRPCVFVTEFIKFISIHLKFIFLIFSHARDLLSVFLSCLKKVPLVRTGCNCFHLVRRYVIFRSSGAYVGR